MKILQVGKPIPQTKRMTCSKCNSVFEFTKTECKATTQLGVMHDGLGEYNIRCPVCNCTEYFNWR